MAPATMIAVVFRFPKGILQIKGLVIILGIT